LTNIKRRISKPDIAADIAAPPVNATSAYELFSRVLFGPEQTHSFAGSGQVNSDILPILSYMAPLSLYDSRANIVNMKSIAKYSAPNTNILGWNYNEEEMNMIKETQIKYLKSIFQ